jgi:hypothetical protein
MTINGTNNNFKVSTIGNDVPHNDWAAQETDPTASVDDLFELDGGTSSGSANNADPLDDYTLGEISGGAYNTSSDVASAGWLEDFPPILEDVLANNESAINYLDMVMARYESAQEQLHALKKQYEQVIQDSSLSNDELKAIQMRLPLIDEALSRCESEMAKCSDMAGEREKTFISEQRSMKDLNNDSWIGRPYMKGSYYVQINDDGTTTYIDPISKKAVPAPLMDPEYQAKLVENDCLTAIDQSASIADDPELGVTDVFLQLDANALQNAGSNTFGAPIDIGVPEYLWVERDPDATGGNIYKTDFDDNQGEEKMVLYNTWETGGGLVQSVPDDLSKYAQVKVTGVKVYSVEVARTDSGDPLYRTVVEYYNDQTLISRISVEGCAASSDNPAAAMTSDGAYIAASSVGIAFHATDRASPVDFDATGLTSTGRHIYGDMVSKLDVSAPGDGGRGDTAYNENIGAFTAADFSTEEWEEGGWTTTTHDLDTYNGMNDRYISSEDDATPGKGPYSTFKTGVFIDGLRGDIKGSIYNDVIVCPGVNEYSDYATEHLPEEAQKIQKGDAFYSNFVHAGSGNDIVVAGRGDNYIEEATFVWIKDSGSMDENFINLPDMPPYNPTDDNPDIAPNRKDYVHVTGGKNRIYNPHEYSFADDQDAKTPEETEINNGSYLDDYYDVAGGLAEFGNPFDDDVLNSAGLTSSGTFNGERLTDAKKDAQEEWYNELTAVPSAEDVETDVNWDEVMGAKTDLDSEMNGFFDEMFGDLNSFMGEYEDQQ